MARRSEHSLEELKAMVLDAAETIVIEEGFSALKMRRIAAEIGYTVGSIYMVFNNMDDLILHIKGRTLDAITDQMTLVQCSSPEHCLEELARVYINYASQNLNRWSMVFEHRLPEDTETPEWYQEKIDNLYGKFEAQFALLAPRLTTEQRRHTALAFLGGLHGICVFMLTSHIGGLYQNDLEESVVLLIRRFIHDGWINPMGGTIPPKNPAMEAWRVWPSAKPV